MQQGTSFLKRFIALVLTLVLLLSNANMGVALQAFAAESATKTVGQVMAENYELTETEAHLLEHGYIVGSEAAVNYSIPEDADNLIKVDTDNKKISVETPTDWTVEKVEIVVGNEVKETVTLNESGEGTYTYGGNAFSVKAYYSLSKTIAGQEAIFAAIKSLKTDLDNAYDVYSLATTVVELENGKTMTSLELLEEVRENILVGLVTGEFNQKVSDTLEIKMEFQTEEARTAVGVLESQIEAMRALSEAYQASASKVQHVLEMGAEYRSALTDLHESLSAIQKDPVMKDTGLPQILEAVKPDAAAAWSVFTSNLDMMVSGLGAATGSNDWTTVGQKIVNDGANFAELDELINKLPETLTSVSDSKSMLICKEAVVQYNLSMFNVTVNVALMVVGDEVDSAELVQYGTKSVVLTLGEDATKAEILAEVEANGIVAEALAEWAEVYVDGKFDVVESDLPATLTKDIDYTITYSPKSYTVTLEYDNNKELTVPYGYKLTLERHEDLTKAYDYFVNGEKTAQGQVVTIVEDTDITRVQGKSYVGTDLYTVVANNYGNDVVKAILTSGALNGNVAINYREPDPADAGSLLKLKNGTLTAEDYASDYEELSWDPYTYGAEGTESYFSGNTASCSAESVKVQYMLAFTNFGQAKAQEVLNLAATLKAEAADQKSVMDSLAGLEDTLSQLDKTKLSALNGAIDGTDFTEGDGTDTDAENLEIRAEMKAIVSAIIANNLEGNKLKIYNIVVAYNDDGMSYYYQNYAAIKEEVSSLAGYLTNLMDKEEALKILCKAAGFPEYADKISGVETQLNDYNARLIAPNSAIDVNSDKLGKLVAALTAAGDAAGNATGSPYVLSKILTALDESQVMVQVIIDTPNGGATVTGAVMESGTVLDQAAVNALKTSVDAKVAELLGKNVKYYELSVEGTAVENLVGTKVEDNINIYYTYEVKEYTVKIDGESNQTISINDLEINLPKHPVSGYRYEYTVDGESGITSSTYTFKLEQIDRLFKDGSYTITRVEIDEVKERFEAAFGDWIVYDEDGNIVALKAEVDASQDGIMDFAMTIVNSGYGYIGLNNEDLLYTVKDADGNPSPEIMLQTLINALLNDEGFSSDRMIALGKDGKGVFLETKITIDDEKPAARAIGRYMNLPFTLYLKSVPGQMATVSKGLEKVKPYMSFHAENGLMNIDLNLPEKIYEVYLTALLATGNVDKTDMNAINSEIAFQFLWDYVEEILATDADTTTYTNTLAQVGVNYDLTGAEDYYQLVKKALKNEGVVINPEDDNDEVDIRVTAKSQKAIDGLISLLGVDISAYETYLGMVYEYKYEDAKITADAKAVLKNTEKVFQVAVVDIDATETTNKADYSAEGVKRINQINGKAVIILLTDLEGNLTINDTTLLDLNGHTINGNITVKGGTLLIVDSTLNTENAGKVTGLISGNAKIFAGVYGSDVSKFLMNGYKQLDNGAVANRLYTLETDENNNTTVAISTDLLRNRDADYVDFAKALAIDLAVDFVLNNYTSASLSVAANQQTRSLTYYDLYNLQFNDLIALLESSTKAADLVQKLIDSIKIENFDTFINDIIVDMLNFGAIEEAAKNGDVLFSRNMITHPFAVKVYHQTSEDYIEFGIGANEEITKNFSISLKAALDADNDYIAKVANVLNKVVDDSSYVTVNIDEVANKFVETHGVEIPVITGGADVNLILDLTVEDGKYAKMIAEALGYTYSNAMKAPFDALTAGKIIDKLETYVDGNNKIEEAAAAVLNTLSKALRKLGVEDKAFGDFDSDDDGVYILRGTVKNKDFRGVFEDINVNVYIEIKLFDENTPVECDHIRAERVENEVSPDCYNGGSYDVVIYCPKCGVEFSRTRVEVPANGHAWDNEEYTVVTEADCENNGLMRRTCTVCGCVEEKTIDALGHQYETVTTPPTCTEKGYTTYTCTVCGDTYDADYVDTIPHEDENPKDHICDVCGNKLHDHWDDNNDHVCDYCGNEITDCVDEDKDHLCDVCGNRISCCYDCNRDHICDWCGEVFSVCVDRNHNHICDICWKILSVCADENDDHLCDYCLRIVSLCCDKNRDHFCDLCGRQISVCIDTDRDGYCDICGVELEWVIRLYGENRAQTARDAAEELKAIMGVHKFDNIVYASGYNFPDALAGTYFANEMEAPVLMYFGGENAMNMKYIKENLAKDGTVYILGGIVAMPAFIEEELVAAGINVVRLGGETRFETNLEILDATGFDGGETVLVCAGYEFADALSASATGLPILLVNNAYTELRESQVEYLENLGEDCNFIIIGGTNAVSAELAAVIAEYDVDGEVERIGGATRFETSLMVAEKFFPDADQAILAYAWMFPDALCGGTIGYALGAPVILTSDVKIDLAADYMAKRDINSGYVMGGALRLSDEIVCIAFDLESAKDIHLR